MNALEQRIRHTAVQQAEAQIDQLAAGLEALGTITQAIDERQVALGQGIADAFDANAARVDDLVASVRQLQVDGTERWLSCGATHKRLGDRIARFEHLTLWQRLRWLVRGV